MKWMLIKWMKLKQLNKKWTITSTSSFLLEIFHFLFGCFNFRFVKTRIEVEYIIINIKDTIA